MNNNLSVSDYKKKHEELNIVKHGTNYVQSEETDLQEKYPFCLCPECLSSNTKIIKRFKKDSDELFGATTGTIHSMVIPHFIRFLCFGLIKEIYF